LLINQAVAITLNLPKNRVRDAGQLNVMVRQFLLFDFYIAHFGPKIDNAVL